MKNYIEGRDAHGTFHQVPVSAIRSIRLGGSIKEKRTLTTIEFVGSEEVLTLVSDHRPIHLPEPDEPKREFMSLILKDGRWITLAVSAIAYLDDLNETIVLKDGAKLELGTPFDAVSGWLKDFGYWEEFNCPEYDGQRTPVCEALQKKYQAQSEAAKKRSA